MPSMNIRQRFSSFRNTLSDASNSLRPRKASSSKQESNVENAQKLPPPNTLSHRTKPETVSPAERRCTADQSLIPIPKTPPGVVASIKLHRIEKSDLKVKHKVGEGSFGLVLSATWIPKDKTVVLKVLKPRDYFEERLADSDVTYHDIVSAFRREIRLMQDCGEHPNIVPILGKGESDTMLVMAAASLDLHKLCKKVGTDLSLQLIEKWGRDILSAISHIHERGIIHQDVKTSNILIFEDGDAKICDFGLAVRMKDDLKVNRELCTLWYRPPELLMGCRTYTPLVDEWGVACIMLEMLIGEVPIPGDTSRVCTCNRQSHINYNKDQLSRIFRLIGSPKENEVSGLACWDHFRTWPQQQACLSTVVHNSIYQRVVDDVDSLSDHDLTETVKAWTSALTQLMAHIPENRLTADEALTLPLFQEQPRQTPSSSLPPCPSSPASVPSSPVRIPSYTSSPVRALSSTAQEESSDTNERTSSNDTRTSSSNSVASTICARSTRGSIDSGALQQAQKSTSMLMWQNLPGPVNRISSPLTRPKSKRIPIEERSSSAIAVGEPLQLISP